MMYMFVCVLILFYIWYIRSFILLDFLIIKKHINCTNKYISLELR